MGLFLGDCPTYVVYESPSATAARTQNKTRIPNNLLGRKKRRVIPSQSHLPFLPLWPVPFLRHPSILFLCWCGFLFAATPCSSGLSSGGFPFASFASFASCASFASFASFARFAPSLASSFPPWCLRSLRSRLRSLVRSVGARSVGGERSEEQRKNSSRTDSRG